MVLIMITGFSTQTIGGSFVDTQGQRYQVKTTWIEEAGISSTWIEESLQTINSTWAKETINATTWVEEVF
jgi:hypothetical protein